MLTLENKWLKPDVLYNIINFLMEVVWFNKNVFKRQVPCESAIDICVNLDLPVYDLEDWLKESTWIIKNLLSKWWNVVLFVAWWSASGKTSAVADKYSREFSDSMILSLDDYYRGESWMNSQDRKDLNFDHPDALELDLAMRHIADLKKGKSIKKPIYDFKTWERSWYEEISPKKLIIVEWLFALSDKLKKAWDYGVFVDIWFHGRMIRRLLRDVKRTSWSPSDILKYFTEIVEPMHQQHILTTVKNAWMVIQNEYNAEAESNRSQEEEIQLKIILPDWFDEDTLKWIWLKFIDFAKQTDYYYNPYDRDFSITWECLRIRDIWTDEVLLTYKWPLKPAEVRVRNKFEFFVPQNVSSNFLQIYWTQLKIIEKIRKYYNFKNIVICVDDVSCIEWDSKISMWKFVEFRFMSYDIGVTQDVFEFLYKIWLNDAALLKDSYLQLSA